MLKWLVSLGLVFGATSASAEDLTQNVAHGSINWGKGVVVVTGSGAPSLKASNAAVARLGAEQAAKMSALRNALEAIKGVRVKGEQVLGDMMAGDGAVSAKVQGVVRGFKVLDTKYYSDGGIDLVVEVPLSGVVAAIAKPDTTKPAAATDYTGVIIDARGVDLAPSMLLTLVDAEGGAIMDPASLNATSAQKHGSAAWVKSLDAAKKDARIGAKPLIVSPAKSLSPASGACQFSDVDSKSLKAALSLLQDGKVIVVVKN